jgi:Uma2 family endonuclease
MSLHRKAFPTEVDYPETDGKPMAETDIHADLMIQLRESLKSFFASQPDVYVSGNLLLYYEEGNPRKSVSPDVFVVFGVGKHKRRIYKLWQEGRAPDVVFEISSRGTWGEDLHKKFQLYARLGVGEYYVFDPEYDYLYQPLLAFRLEDGLYEAVEVVDGRVHSDALGLDLVDTGETLRLFDPRTGRFLPTREEIEAAREQAEAAREQAEAELARLREELARLRQPN